MKRQVRYGVFETNSSSMHSLVIRNPDATYYDEETGKEEKICHILTHEEMLESLKDGNLRDLEHGILDFSYENWNFGRAPFRICSTFNDKVQYLLASKYRYGDIDDNEQLEINEAIRLIKSLVPEVKEVRIPEKDEYGYRNINFDEPYYQMWQRKNGFTDLQFLTDTRYIPIQDGDEYCKWSSLVQHGIVDNDVVKDTDVKDYYGTGEDYE